MATGSYTIEEINNGITSVKNDRELKIASFQTQLLNTYTNLYNKVKAENDRLENTYNKIKNEHSVDAQKSKYVGLSEEILKTVYTYSFWIYIILSIVLCVFIYYKPFSNIIKVSLIVVVLGFPFYIYPLENLTYIICIYLYNIMVSTIYNNGYSNTNIEYSVQATHEIMAQTAKSPPLTLT